MVIDEARQYRLGAAELADDVFHIDPNRIADQISGLCSRALDGRADHRDK